MIPRKITDQITKLSIPGDYILFELIKLNIKKRRFLRLISLIIKPRKKMIRSPERSIQHLYYITDGTGKLEFPDLNKTVILEPYMLVHVPEALKHIIINESSTVLHILDIVMVE